MWSFIFFVVILPIVMGLFVIFPLNSYPPSKPVSSEGEKAYLELLERLRSL